MSDEVEFWPEKDGSNSPKFINIAALYSELIAVSSTGQLYQWKWSDPDPFKPEVKTFIYVIVIGIRLIRIYWDYTSSSFMAVTNS